MRILICCLLLALIIPQAALAVVSFTQLDEDTFVVSHRIKGIGLRGKAIKLVYTKAASLCIAAGYSHMRIVNEESESGQSDDTANASMRVQFYFQDGEDRLDCDRQSDPEYILQAREKLAKRGYQWPEEPSQEMLTTEAEGEGGDTGSCSIPQIAAMARTGLNDEQIIAACGG